MFFINRTLKVLLVLVIMTFANIARATDWYINDNATANDQFTDAPGLDAPGRGTSDAPYASYEYLRINETINDHDNIYIDAGFYNWPTIPIFDNVSVLNFHGAGKSKTFINTIQSSPGQAPSSILVWTAITSFEGMTISNHYGVVVRSLPVPAPNFQEGRMPEMLNCDLYSMSGASDAFCIHATSCRGQELVNCKIFSKSAAVWLENCYDIEILQSEIISQNTTAGAIRVSSDAFQSDCAIRDCSIEGASGPNSIIVDVDHAYGLKLERNKFQCGGAQIAVNLRNAPVTFLMNNNFVWNVNRGLLADASTTNLFQIIQNSFNTKKTVIEAQGPGLRVRGNIFKTHSSSANDFCIKTTGNLDVSTSTSTPQALDMNLYYHARGAQAASINGVQYANLSQLQSSTVFEEAGLTGAPSWFNGSQGEAADLHIWPGSIAVDAIDAVSRFRDIDNENIFGNGVDMGADEIQVSAARLSANEVNKPTEPSFHTQGNLLIVEHKGTDLKVEFYTINGVLMKTIYGENSINLSQFPSGIYLTRVTSDGISQVDRLLVP